jgi:hypothetical protein
MRAEEDLQAAIRRVYRWVLFLGPDVRITAIEIPDEQPDAGRPLGELIRETLLREDVIGAEIDPGELLRHWPARQEWSTRAVRDACYASPALPRPLDATAVRRAIAQGVARGLLGYVVRDDEEGQPVQVRVDTALSAEEVRLGDDTVILRAEDARALLARPTAGEPAEPIEHTPRPVGDASVATRPLHWEGAVSWQTYTQIGERVLARFAATPGLTIRVGFSIPAEGLSAETAEQVRAALRDLGLM